MLIHLICAARPNFMKVAPLYHALKNEPWADPVIVHTGQHYDLNMSDSFFRDLRLPEPHIHLGVGSGTHAEQTGKVMISYEKVLMEKRPDLVVVVGDVNSTMACTLAASKVVYNNKKVKRDVNGSLSFFQPSALSCELGHRPLIAHLEAGLRSFDRTMPEEINRLVTDALADILWTPSLDGDENLLREGVPAGKIQRVGNIMIDSLEMMKNSIETQATHKELDLTPGRYGVVTLHRPSNVDNPEIIRRLCKLLVSISHDIPIAFPVHPRTMKNLDRFGLLASLSNCNGLRLLEPLSYIRFMSLVLNCRLAITDSGGIQEETSYLRIPCLTLRENTERPITITQGTNQLCGLGDLEDKVAQVLDGPSPALEEDRSLGRQNSREDRGASEKPERQEKG
jgi:UDP-N-acetylglucosamine 2-epimerase (non-hydrolysing)